MAEHALRVSVRQMVEFTLLSGDLTPVSMAAMQAGARGHRARQAESAAQSERAVRWAGECEELPIEVIGRADLYDEENHLVEELKLLAPHLPVPSAPHPAHRMQAVCYGYMLCEELNLPAISVCVNYVTEQGDVRASFPETLSCDEARHAFFDMLRPWVIWQRLQIQHEARRNTSLSSLPFPYDTYRAGQREMAVQVYTAIRQKKRLFATLPTGTGKSAATLFPALEALGEGKTRQIFYLTARGTTQQSALDALRRMTEQGLKARYITLTAKEKCCPEDTMRCHPDHCPRSRGYFDRLNAALQETASASVWTPDMIRDVCNRHLLCPFEFSLSLCEMSDVVICDYNYAFDPTVMIQRIFLAGRRVTLLIDEAHNLPSRVRSMLSCTLDGRNIAAMRRAIGKYHSRKHPLYLAFTAFLTALRNCENAGNLLLPLEALLETVTEHLDKAQPDGFHDLFRELLQSRMCLRRLNTAPEDYHISLLPHGKEKECRLLCLNITSHIAQCTQKTDGCVCFSATLSPLEQMRTLLGGDEDDALFALPSPFPRERLLVLRRDVSTRYTDREATAHSVARSILAMFRARSGKYIAYFPSYAYMESIRDQLLVLQNDLPLNVQERSMDDDARQAFLSRFTQNDDALLSLCVLGGIFSEGIDLPGQRLIGVAVVGVGLPQVNDEQEALRVHYEHTFRDGFGHAYRYPGMHKVLQAAGRVIRSETDAGVVLLLDDRYRQSAYASLLPAHYQVHKAADDEEIRTLTQDFWRRYGI